MNKYLKILFSILLAVYLVIALTMTARENDDAMCTGMTVTVEDADGDGGATRFVTPAELIPTACLTSTRSRTRAW